MGAVGLSFFVQEGLGAYFQGVEKIVDISSQKVVLKTKKGEILVEGKNLKLSSYFDKDLSIIGSVSKVEVKGGNS